MLGRQVVRAVEERGHTAIGLSHREMSIDDAEAVMMQLAYWRPEAVINCAGKLPGADPVDMAMTNVVGPALLAHWKKARIVNMSTDCVFSGKRGGWIRSVTDRPDPIDSYGRTKLAGEIDAQHVLNVRGSFIDPRGGLLKWLLDQPPGAAVSGWENAWWNGTSAYRMAMKLVLLAEDTRSGVIHVAAENAISKGVLLREMSMAFDLDVKIVRSHQVKVYRTLSPDLYVEGWPLIADELIEEIAACRSA